MTLITIVFSIFFIAVAIGFLMRFFKKRDIKEDCNNEVQQTQKYIHEEIDWSQLPSDSLFNLINNERKNRKLSELLSSKLLTQLAKEKVEEMMTTNILSHSGFEERLLKSYSNSFFENIGNGYSTEKSFFYAYMNSDKHRANICRSGMTHIGIYTKKEWNCCIFAKY